MKLNNKWLFIVFMMALSVFLIAGSPMAAVGDWDDDGILDDGDSSGLEGDNPCTGGVTANCDDNCPYLANALQTDDLPAAHHGYSKGNGVGDDCENDTANYARFNWYQGAACYQVNFDAFDNGTTDCDWDFNGEGTATDTCVTSYTFATGGAKLVTLTTDGVNERFMAVTAKAVNALPDTGMSVAATSADGMELTVTDGSSALACDTSTALTAIVVWGDGTTSIASINESDVVGSHTYTVPGTYTISYSTRDSAGNKAFAENQTWTVPDADGGYVCDVEGDIYDTAIAGGTMLTLVKGGNIVVKKGKTDATGHYAIPNVQAGITYTIIPSRSGYNFTNVDDLTNTILLDPLVCTGGSANATGNDFFGVEVW